MYVMIKISTLKELYREVRVLRERSERYLRMIDRYRASKPEEEELCKGTPLRDMFSGFTF